jgi:tetratricopeptide (TPR) repeat protein
MQPMIRSVATALASTLFAASVWAVDATALALAQGDKLWAAGRLDDARKSFEQAVAADPRSPAALMKLGGLLLSSRSYPAAIQTYQRALSLDPNNARAWMGLGLAYLHGGQRELSRAAFDEAVRVDPSRKAQLAQWTEKPSE